MTTENNKGMKDASASNVSHVSRKPLQCIHIKLHMQVTLSKSRCEAITMPMMCSLLQHGFLPSQYQKHIFRVHPHQVILGNQQNTISTNGPYLSFSNFSKVCVVKWRHFYNKIVNKILLPWQQSSICEITLPDDQLRSNFII